MSFFNNFYWNFTGIGLNFAEICLYPIGYCHKIYVLNERSFKFPWKSTYTSPSKLLDGSFINYVLRNFP